MQVKLGEKIRELRRRDGRKQEDLAAAVGVSNQAVSRWESEGSYPDVEIIPAIANYFHVTIDELFGYSGDREERIREIIAKTEEMARKGEFAGTVTLLRDAAAEFPSEGRILVQYVLALVYCGWQKHGIRARWEQGSEFAGFDHEYNSSNEYFREAARVFEKAIGMELEPSDRDTILLMMVMIYGEMGEFEKAKELCEKQNSIIVCRELLLPETAQGEDAARYRGEAILALLMQLKNVFITSVAARASLSLSSEGVRLLTGLARLYETVFSDGKFGYGHLWVSELYLHAAIYESHCGSADQAFEYFEKGFEHHKKYLSIRCTGEYVYTAPIVAGVTFPSENFPLPAGVLPSGASSVGTSGSGTSADCSFRKLWIDTLTEDVAVRIRADARFSECFE